MQVRYLNADGINFGMQHSSSEVLTGLEARINALFNTSSYQAQDLENWSLAVDLTSHLCFESGSGKVPVEFMIQVWPLRNLRL